MSKALKKTNRECDGACLAPNYRHGLTYHPHYQRWVSMNDRCYNSNHKRYKDYGGRGITVIPEWRKDAGPEAFCAWMDENLKECPEGSSLDRKDNSKGYEPGNLQWATSEEQNSNQRAHKKASDLPWGVYRHGKSFQVQVRNGKRNLYFGTYTTVEEASEIAQLVKLQRSMESGGQSEDLHSRTEGARRHQD